MRRQRPAAGRLEVWDRSELPLSDLIKDLNAANALAEGPNATPP